MPRDIYGVRFHGNANVEDFLPKESLGITKRLQTHECDKTEGCEGYLEEHLIKNGWQIMCNGCGKVYSTTTYRKSKYPKLEIFVFSLSIVTIIFVILTGILWLLQ